MSDCYLVGTINHVRLTVTDIPRAECYYGPLLGFLGYKLEKKDAKRLAWAALDGFGGWRKFILSAANLDSTNKTYDRYSPGLHHLGFNVARREQVDEFYKLLQRTGAQVLDPPAEYDYQPSYYAVYFADPDGIKLEVVHIPFFVS